MSTPEHLSPIELPEIVNRFCDRVEQLKLPSSVLIQLKAFRESRTPHDGRRLITALRYVLGCAVLADELARLIECVR